MRRLASLLAWGQFFFFTERQPWRDSSETSVLRNEGSHLSPRGKGLVMLCSPDISDPASQEPEEQLPYSVLLSLVLTTAWTVPEPASLGQDTDREHGGCFCCHGEEMGWSRWSSQWQGAEVVRQALLLL